MLDKLDKTDKKILYELDWNARQPDAKIAKKLHISRSVANYRIKRLEEQEYITGYYTVIDASKIGYYTAAIKLELIGASTQQEQELEKHLTQHNKVFYLSETDENNTSFGVWVQDIYELEAFMQELKKKFRKIILQEHISLFTQVLQYPRAYLTQENQKRQITQFGKGKYETIDELDKKILLRIAQDARAQTITLSQELSTPARTIAYRIKQLEKKNIIQHYRANINFAKYNYQYFKVDIELSNLQRLTQLKEYITKHPNILYHEESIGGSDFEFDIEIPNKQDLIQLMHELKTTYPEIRRWKYYTIYKYKKIKYCPDLQTTNN